jgi:hypothetical protein
MTERARHARESYCARMARFPLVSPAAQLLR